MQIYTAQIPKEIQHAIRKAKQYAATQTVRQHVQSVVAETGPVLALITNMEPDVDTYSVRAMVHMRVRSSAESRSTNLL